MTFVYLSGVQTFLANKIDENPNYADCIRVFEFMVGRNKTIGEPLRRGLPISYRLFKAFAPVVEPLVFTYQIQGDVIFVVKVVLLKDLLPNI